jgi:outer membrane protein
MSFPVTYHFAACALALAAVSAAAAQGTIAQTEPPRLSLEQALALAKSRNGTIGAVAYDITAARARSLQSAAAFMPTVTPQYQYNSNRQQVITTQGNSFIQDEGSSTSINSSFRLLDSGERSLALRSTRQSESATRFNGRQTVRTVLFDVVSQFFEALRSQELQRVNDLQVQRSQAILDQTIARVAVKDAAKKDILQARADVLNAQVTALQARNRTTNAGATLKGTLGLDPNLALPTLEKTSTPDDFPQPGELSAVILQALQFRPDLNALRRSIESTRLSRDLAERQASFGFSADLGFNYQFSPDKLENRTFTFLVSYPLFDGNLKRERARELSATLRSSQLALIQREREVRAEVESTFKEVLTNAERLQAATSAVTAAQENYNAASEAQRLGASNLIDVLTAQVSLVTAESNAIEAEYDYDISVIKLKLVTGQPVPGE